MLDACGSHESNQYVTENTRELQIYKTVGVVSEFCKIVFYCLCLVGYRYLLVGFRANRNKSLYCKQSFTLINLQI